MKNLTVWYTDSKVTEVIIIDENTGAEVVTVPVLFSENRSAMAWEAYALAERK